MSETFSKFHGFLLILFVTLLLWAANFSKAPILPKMPGVSEVPPLTLLAKPVVAPYVPKSQRAPVETSPNSPADATPAPVEVASESQGGGGDSATNAVGTSASAAEAVDLNSVEAWR